MKKVTKIAIGLTATAGVAAAVAIPVTLLVLNKKEVIKYINPKGGLFPSDGSLGAESIQDFLKRVDTETDKDSNIVDNAMKSTVKYLYDKEQVGSIELQKMNFNYKIYRNEVSIKNLMNDSKNLDPQISSATGSSKTDLQKKKNDLEKQIQDLKNENKKIEDRLKNIADDKIPYESDTFSIDYPTILQLRSVLDKRQTNIIKDERDGYVNKFDTTQEGEKAWIEERKNKYAGASSDAEAASSLTFNLIKTHATKQYTRNVVSTYTMEQALAEDKNKNPIFPFLNTYYKAYLQSSVDGSDFGHYKFKTGPHSGERITRSTKIFFIGSESKIPEKIIIAVTPTEESIVSASKDGLIKVQHMLIAAKQDEKGYTLPWTVTKETLKKLFAFYGPNSKDGTGASQWINEIDKVFADGVDAAAQKIADEKTKQIIKHMSDNGGTIDKSGDLGTLNDLEQVNKNVPGFGIGLLEAIIDLDASVASAAIPTSAAAVIGTRTGQSIINALKTVGTSLLTGITNNDELFQKIDKFTDQELQQFGNGFKEAVVGQGNGNSDLHFTYKWTQNRYIVVSNNGIHIIKVTRKSDAKKLSDGAKADMLAAFLEKGTSKITTEYAKILNKGFTTSSIIQSLLGGADATKYKAFIFKDMGDLKDDKGAVKNQATVMQELEEFIKDQLKAEAVGIINKMFSKNIKDFLPKAYDAHMRESGIIDAAKIYEQIKFRANKEAGVI